MDIAEKRLPQDGHFMGVIDGVELNIRVSVIPTIFGEKIVMRYLNSNSTIDRLSTFGMTEENFKKVNHMMSMPWNYLCNGSYWKWENYNTLYDP